MLRADDNGQGGAFALFSLLKRQAELGKKSKVRLQPGLSWDQCFSRQCLPVPCRLPGVARQRAVICTLTE